MPLDIARILEQELSLKGNHVQNVLTLLGEEATIPFIARYRKEQTGEMNEIVLRQLVERYDYLRELEERKKTVLNTIREQNKLTPELESKIDTTLSKTELEDLYLPYKPKKRTRSTQAREKGLEPLAIWIQTLTSPASLTEEATKFISEEKGVKTAEEALAGASDILAEGVAEKAVHRQFVREFVANEGVFKSSVKPEFADKKTKFDMYRDYASPVKDIPAHNLLALRRGESDGVLSVTLDFDSAVPIGYLQRTEIPEGISGSEGEAKAFYLSMTTDAFERLMKNSIVGEVRYTKKELADLESIQTFDNNLRGLLLASPAGMRPTLGVDPGFRTGCKIVALDETGKFLEYQTVFPHQSEAQRAEAAKTVTDMLEKHGIKLIAIGNGTAGRETESFIRETLAAILAAKPDAELPVCVMVSESGASVYSASQAAIEEFPDKDITVRGAVSIGRRLQDPLAELVKIDPKSLGVGQYQHDVDQKLLKKKLDEVTESCVNYVGVDLNTASKELLSYVAGVNSAAAKSIVEFRNQNGAFKDRAALLGVPKVGPKLFEQAAGFLRIRGGTNPLDNTAVHPESYSIVEKMAADLKVPVEELVKRPDAASSIDVKSYTTETAGEITVRDILEELAKKGRDPREEFKYASFRPDIKEPKDLQTQMQLEGVVTNVANFGAFVDIGVHQDGLVHISQLANRYVKDANEIVKVGQVVKVKVLEVDLALNRISLSMRLEDASTQGKSGDRSERKSFDRNDRNTGDRKGNDRMSSDRKGSEQKSSDGETGGRKEGGRKDFNQRYGGRKESGGYKGGGDKAGKGEEYKTHKGYDSQADKKEKDDAPKFDTLATGIDALKAKFNSK